MYEKMEGRFTKFNIMYLKRSENRLALRILVARLLVKLFQSDVRLVSSLSMERSALGVPPVIL